MQQISLRDPYANQSLTFVQIIRCNDTGHMTLSTKFRENEQKPSKEEHSVRVDLNSSVRE